jgi:hypothetical protein
LPRISRTSWSSGTFDRGATVDGRGQLRQRRTGRDMIDVPTHMQHEGGEEHQQDDAPELCATSCRPPAVRRPAHASRDAPDKGMTARPQTSAILENSWKNPNALSGSQYCTHRPVPKMRATLAVTAIGMLESASTTRRHVVRSRQVAEEDSHGEEAHQRADAAARFSHLQRHRGQLDDVALLQHRTPRCGRMSAANSEARSCNGKVIWLKRMVAAESPAGAQTTRTSADPAWRCPAASR